MKNRNFVLNLTNAVFFLSITVLSPLAADELEEGKKLLVSGRPEQAIPVLHKASQKTGIDAKIYLYLGVAYLRVGKYSEALGWLAQGKNIDIINKYLYCYNMGNVLAAQNRLSEAEAEFSESISINADYAPAFLNRANVLVKNEKYNGALSDYKTYLNLKPQSSQKQSILRMISALEQKEQEEAMAENIRAAHKIAEEDGRRYAEDRDGKFTEEIDASLSSVKDAVSVSAGAENTIDYLEENELD